MRTVRLMSWLTMPLLSLTAWNVAAVESTAPSAPVLVAATSSPPVGPILKTASVKPAYVQGMGQSVDSAALAKFSGGTEVTNTMTLNGSVSDNTSDHVVTGANVISSGSFGGAAGLPMVIQNSGNGVLIQNATIINVQFQP